MVQAIITLNEHEDRILNIVKGKFGLKNKSDAVSLIIDKFEEEFIEPELKPEYVEKIRNIEKKGKFTSYKSLAAFRKEIEENA